MDYEGPAVIQWWANGTFALVGSVQLQVTALDRGWKVRATAAAADDWAVVFGFSSPHRLVFPDGSAFDVGVGRPEPDGSFEVWPWDEEAEHLDPCPRCSGPAWHVGVTFGADDSVEVQDMCLVCGFERRFVFPR